MKGYERRGLLRFEICEYLSNTLWNGFLKQDSVCYAVKRFITFQSWHEIENPGYPMYQLLPSSLDITRQFMEHRPPGFPNIAIYQAWTDERQSPLTLRRPWPLRSVYTNELLVHPKLQQLRDV